MKGNRIFLFLFLLSILGVCIIVEFPSSKEEKSLHDEIRDSILYSKYERYVNPEFDYYSYYSRAMDIEPDSLSGYKNYLKASLWMKDVHIIHETYATSNEPCWSGDTLVISLPQSADSSYLSFDGLKTNNDTIRVNMNYPSDNEIFNDYRYYAKYVRNGRMWFVQSVIYPKDYDDAVMPIKKLIDKWKVW